MQITGIRAHHLRIPYDAGPAAFRHGAAATSARSPLYLWGLGLAALAISVSHRPAARYPSSTERSCASLDESPSAARLAHFTRARL